jgi:hypothetical protein
LTSHLIKTPFGRCTTDYIPNIIYNISEKPSPWNSYKQRGQRPRTDSRKQNTLHKDGVLDLPEGGLLDPRLPVQHLADGVPLPVPHHPRLVLVAVAGPETVKRALGRRADDGVFVVVVVVEVRDEELPGPDVPVVQAVEDDALSLR